MTLTVHSGKFQVSFSVRIHTPFRYHLDLDKTGSGASSRRTVYYFRMAFEFNFPDVGEGIHEGEIVRWRVRVGDEVKEDQPLVEMETAKAIVELPSPKAGTVLAIIGKESEMVHVGNTLVVIGVKGEKWEPKLSAADAPPSSAVTGAEEKQPAQSGPGVIGQIPTEEKGVVLPARMPEAAPTAENEAAILPRTRRLADDLGVNIDNIKGTGPGGLITEKDVIEANEKPRKQSSEIAPRITRNIKPSRAFWGETERMPLSGIRKAVAAHMVKSAFTIPHVTHFDELDASNLAILRESKKAEAEKQGIKLTYLPFIVNALTETLKKHPMMNSFFDDETEEIIIMKYFNIGIAVDTQDGLMVPVIKNADKKDVFQIAAEITDLAQKCRDHKIAIADMQDGTFSITNVGSIGGIGATPIINYGQCAILGIFRMKEKPVAENGRIEIKPIMPLALAFDHRIVDGANAARFMNDLIALLQTKH